jgi:Ras-related protein Rab-2A
MASVQFKYLLKYIIIGDESVGKSNILLRYAQNQFKPEYKVTVGVEFGARNITINNVVYRVQIWDTAGQERFRSITRAYYRNSVCAIIVYDVCNRESFYNVQRWIEDCRAQAFPKMMFVLIGNKCDKENEREVQYNEGESLAKELGIMFYETSALTGQGIENLFTETTNIIAERICNNEYDLSSDSCGIKTGLNPSTQSNTNTNMSANNTTGSGITSQRVINSEHKKGCC